MASDPIYRLYRFDHLGQIIGVKELLCYSDLDAIEKARSLATSATQELWSRERLLTIIKSQNAA
jgi:hypothetical protein